MSTPTLDLAREVVALACRAPSVHNTQPWRWHLLGDSVVDLHADRTRQLPVADPDGRNLALSCGAALHHAVEAAHLLGLHVTVDVLPDADDADFLARLRLSPGVPPADARTRRDVLELRCTDRRRFTSWPVPDSRLHRLAEGASGWGAYAVPVTDVTARFRAELLVDRALTHQATDRRYAEEQARWVEPSRVDGVPVSSAAPPRSLTRAERPQRYAPRTAPSESQRLVESSDGLIAVCTIHDDQLRWLQAGQTLSALWLHATRAGLSIVPLSQVVEVPQTRDELAREVFADLALPQLLLRVGWQEIARTTLPRTPRRPLEDVLTS